jgi:hypothetical protein
LQDPCQSGQQQGRKWLLLCPELAHELSSPGEETTTHQVLSEKQESSFIEKSNKTYRVVLQKKRFGACFIELKDNNPFQLPMYRLDD